MNKRRETVTIPVGIETASETTGDALDEKDDPLFVESVARAMRVLEAFAARPEPLSLSSIAAAAGIGKSAAQRLAHTLARLGYLEQTRAGMVPGRRLVERSYDYLRATPLVSRAIPVLAELRRNAQERVDLSLFDDTSMLYLVRMQSKRDTFYAHLIGRRVPTFCTAGGRAAMAALPREEARDLIMRSSRAQLTPRTTIDPAQAMARVDETRRNGFALAIEEVMIGELAIGAAVIDKAGRPIAAIHVAGSLSEWQPEEFIRKTAPLAVAAANAISAS